MSKKAETLEMITLRRNSGLSWQQIGNRYGISRQSVSRRVAGLKLELPERLPKCARIDKTVLENLYTIKLLSVDKISRIMETTPNLIYQALNFHKIPKRESIKLLGKYKDSLKKLSIGEAAEFDFQGANPYVSLHMSAKKAALKISVKKLAATKFLVTRTR